MTYLNIFLIAFVVCFIVDCSGFVNEIKRFIGRKILKINKIDTSAITLKPFDCSLCMTFWSGIIYLLITNTFSIFTLSYVCLLSYLSINISQLLMWLQDTIMTIQQWIDKINR